MAIILFEKGKGEIVTAPVIREEIGGGRVQISGQMSTQEAQDTALLLRAGALAAPMEIVEERTVGPSLGADNITRGFNSTKIGFIMVAVFMIAYYLMFGVISVLALAANLLLLVALLSMLQATLTLPGMAGIALTLGMAIDANVLINERIREELRNGVTPQAAIHAGYDRAFAHHPGLQHHHLHRRHCAVHVRLGSDQGICGGAVPGHHDFDVQRGADFARDGESDLRPQSEIGESSHRLGRFVQFLKE